MKPLVILVMQWVLAMGSPPNCPSGEEFFSAPSQVVSFATPMPASAVWTRVQSAIERWKQPAPAARRAVAADLRSGTAMLTDDPGRLPPRMAGGRTMAARHTCYVCRSSGPTDYAVALMFIARGERAKGISEVEVYWIGIAKGRRERSWRPEASEAAASAQGLIGLLANPATSN